MANMSYCRFQNTLRDLRDCAQALEVLRYEDEETEPLSTDESRAALQLIEVCKQIAEDFGDE